jgi:lipoprotein-releasing system permease protein
MFRPAALFIGLRYTRAKRRNQFISLISLISMLGIALGVVVLITILSVLNGFDREIKKQVFGMISPIVLGSYNGQISDWQALEKSVAHHPGITGIAPFISGQAMLTNSNVTEPAIVTGINPQQEKNVSALATQMIQGQLTNLKPGQFGIILGENLANHLNVKINDGVIVAIPKGSFTTTGITPSFKQFTVVGIFRAGGGGFGFDAKFAYIDLSDAQNLFGLGNAVSALHINVKDIYAAPRIARELEPQLSPTLRAGNWTEQLGDFFENIRTTKTMMFFIFILIIAVAVFNLISTMVMAVKNKQADIAILRTFGATPNMILTIFVVQGAAIGIGGTFLGVVFGMLLAWNISAISIWIQHVLHTQLISSSVYFVNYLPSELHMSDVIAISIVTLVLCLLATLYPAWTAAKTEPADALRYD